MQFTHSPALRCNLGASPKPPALICLNTQDSGIGAPFFLWRSLNGLYPSSEAQVATRGVSPVELLSNSNLRDI
jgi:hypothetical protein